MPENEPMLDGFETLNEPAAEVTADPAPAPETPPASQDGQSAFDLAKLNEGLRSFGAYGEVKSADEVLRILSEKHSGMSKAQEENAKAQTRLRQLEPFADQLRAPRQEQRFDWNRQPEREEEPVQDRDPLYREVMALKMRDAERDSRDAEREVRESVDALDKVPEYSGFINNEIKRELLIEAAATGNYDVEGIFLKKYRSQLIDHARKSAVQQVAERIQKQNTATAGLGTPSPGSSPPAVDPLRLSPADADAWVDSEIQKIVSDKNYRDQVIADYEAPHKVI